MFIDIKGVPHLLLDNLIEEMLVWDTLGFDEYSKIILFITANMNYYTVSS